jgi:hypothetical protein
MQSPYLFRAPAFAMQSYLAYGLTIHSALALPEFLPAEALSVDYDVTLNLITSPERYFEVDQETDLDRSWTLSVNRDQAVVFIRNAGLFEISAGRQIEITLAPDADEGELRLYVGGVIMAILLYQRNCLVLHSSAVQIDHQVVAFLGMSGAGKSSIAVALEKVGYPIITDDVLALHFLDGGVYAAPGYPQVKLTKESATTLGHDLDQLLPLHRVESKLGYRLQSAFPTALMPLQALFFLNIGEQIAIESLPAQDKFLELLTHSAPTRWQIPGDGLHLTQCARLVQQVPILQLKRPRNLSQLEDSARWVEQYILQSLEIVPG